ncbi:predicted protein [Plenodomus lingam JN3]|uniref:Uncharacterized protein n=1 Tax=Leptosphaeria maculans (strain JN3 / isolate v23.1.3 / race Av1-4-5-6-7-8) TaxID=985895 RepID=E5A634_LEPMJ|nr:predicted protein [Plenodomus lingam JN3]CBX99079.1 predicted protein [Plenodomus lingam JN3]
MPSPSMSVTRYLPSLPFFPWNLATSEAYLEVEGEGWAGGWLCRRSRQAPSAKTQPRVFSAKPPPCASVIHGIDKHIQGRQPSVCHVQFPTHRTVAICDANACLQEHFPLVTCVRTAIAAPKRCATYSEGLTGTVPNTFHVQDPLSQQLLSNQIPEPPYRILYLEVSIAMFRDSLRPVARMADRRADGVCGVSFALWLRYVQGDRWSQNVVSLVVMGLCSNPGFDFVARGIHPLASVAFVDKTDKHAQTLLITELCVNVVCGFCLFFLLKHPAPLSNLPFIVCEDRLGREKGTSVEYQKVFGNEPRLNGDNLLRIFQEASAPGSNGECGAATAGDGLLTPPSLHRGQKPRRVWMTACAVLGDTMFASAGPVLTTTVECLPSAPVPASQRLMGFPGRPGSLQSVRARSNDIILLHRLISVDLHTCTPIELRHGNGANLTRLWLGLPRPDADQPCAVVHVALRLRSQRSSLVRSCQQRKSMAASRAEPLCVRPLPPGRDGKLVRVA